MSERSEGGATHPPSTPRDPRLGRSASQDPRARQAPEVPSNAVRTQYEPARQTPLPPRQSESLLRPQPPPPSPPPATPSLPPTMQLPQLISELVQATVFMTLCQNEREKVEKRKRETETLFERAQRHTTFPSVGEAVQQAREDDNIDLARIDEKIKTHQALCAQLANSLHVHLNKDLGGAEVDTRKLEELERQTNAAQSATQDAKTSSNARFRKVEDATKSIGATIKPHDTMAQQNTESISRAIKKSADDAGQINRHKKLLEGLQSKTDRMQNSISALTSKLNSLESVKHIVADHCASTLDPYVDSLNQNGNALKCLQDECLAVQGRVTLLEKERTATKADMVARNALKGLQDECLAVQGRVTLLEKERTTDMAARLKRLETELAQLSDATRLSETKPESLSEANRSISDVQARLEQSETKLTELSDKIQSISDLQARLNRSEAELKKVSGTIRSISGIQSQFEQLKTSLRDTKDTADTMRSLSDMEMRLKNLETHLMHHSDSSKLQALSSQFADFQELQQMGDDLRLGELEELKKQLQSQNEIIVKMQDDHKSVLSETSKLEQAAAATTANEKAIAELVSNMPNINQSIRILQIGLHSLESRYNSLTTEPLVKQMTTAMREMYPSQGAMEEQMSKLTTALKAIPQLRGKIAEVATIHNAFVKDVRQDYQQLAAEVNGLKETHDQQALAKGLEEMSQQLTAIKAKMEQEVIPGKTAHVKQIQAQGAQIQSLRQAWHEMLLPAQKSHEASIQELRKLCSHDLAPVQDMRKLSDNLEALKREYGELNKSLSTIAEKINAGQERQDIQDLRTCHGQIEDEQKQTLQELQQQVDQLASSFNKHVSDAKEQLKAQEAANTEFVEGVSREGRRINEELQCLKAKLLDMEVKLATMARPGDHSESTTRESSPEPDEHVNTPKNRVGPSLSLPTTTRRVEPDNDDGDDDDSDSGDASSQSQSVSGRKETSHEDVDKNPHPVARVRDEMAPFSPRDREKERKEEKKTKKKKRSRDEATSTNGSPQSISRLPNGLPSLETTNGKRSKSDKKKHKKKRKLNTHDSLLVIE